MGDYGTFNKWVCWKCNYFFVFLNENILIMKVKMTFKMIQIEFKIKIHTSEYIIDLL